MEEMIWPKWETVSFSYVGGSIFKYGIYLACYRKNDKYGIYFTCYRKNDAALLKIFCHNEKQHIRFVLPNAGFISPLRPQGNLSAPVSAKHISGKEAFVISSIILKLVVRINGRARARTGPFSMCVCITLERKARLSHVSSAHWKCPRVENFILLLKKYRVYQFKITRALSWRVSGRTLCVPYVFPESTGTSFVSARRENKSEPVNALTRFSERAKKRRAKIP